MVKKLVFADSPYSLAADPNFVTGAIEEVFLECDTSGGAIVINLPSINALTFPNVKVKVADIGGAAQTNNITINPDSASFADTINGSTASQKITQNGGSARFECVSLKTDTHIGQWLGTIYGSVTNAVKIVKVLSAQSPYTVLGTEDIIDVDSLDGAVNILLRQAIKPAKQLLIRDTGGHGTANNITATAFAGDTINGAATMVIVTNNGFMNIYNAGPGPDATKYFSAAKSL